MDEDFKTKLDTYLMYIASAITRPGEEISFSKMEWIGDYVFNKENSVLTISRIPRDITVQNYSFEVFIELKDYSVCCGVEKGNLWVSNHLTGEGGDFDEVSVLEAFRTNTLDKFFRENF